MVRIIRKKRTAKARAFPLRKKVCMFCTEKINTVDYKEVGRLSKFITERGKISSRRGSGACARHQRMLARAIRQARFIALLPFVRK
ncbi:30S ribosomal protein S18 [Candidatus Omnitrophota bacterium]